MLECVQKGSVEELRQYCLDDPECVGFTLKPGGALRLTTDLGEREPLSGGLSWPVGLVARAAAPACVAAW